MYAIRSYYENCPMERQENILQNTLSIIRSNYQFETFIDVSAYFKKVINFMKQINYTEFQSEGYYKFENELKALLKEQNIDLG